MRPGIGKGGGVCQRAEGKRRRGGGVRGTGEGELLSLLGPVSRVSKEKGRKRGRGGPEPVSWGHTTAPSACAFPVAPSTRNISSKLSNENNSNTFHLIFNLSDIFEKEILTTQKSKRKEKRQFSANKKSRLANCLIANITCWGNQNVSVKVNS